MQLETVGLTSRMTVAAFDGYDGKVRLKVADFSRAALRHNFSFLDDAVQADAPVPCAAAGCTEWVGDFFGKSISVGWDWYLDANAGLTLLQAVAPRSNICVIDEKGYDLDDAEGTKLLFDFLKTRFWHDEVKEICEEIPNKPSH